MARRDANAHTDRVRSVIADEAAPAASAVAASWRRCMTLYGLDPDQSCAPEILTEAQLREARQQIEPLTRVARHSLDRLFAAVSDLGCCVLLTTKDGVPVERRGTAAEEGVFQDWGLRLGAVWSEAQQGTNGIGTCLAEGRALTIHRDQHFRTRNTDLSCTVAPIYDHRGRLAAALDVSCCRDTLGPSALGPSALGPSALGPSAIGQGAIGLLAVAVADAARAIEAANFRRVFADARILLSPDAERNAASLLAVDRHDLVIGATRSARLELGISDARIAAQLPAADVLFAGGGRRRRAGTPKRQQAVGRRTAARGEASLWPKRCDRHEPRRGRRAWRTGQVGARSLLPTPT